MIAMAEEFEQQNAAALRRGAEFVDQNSTVIGEAQAQVNAHQSMSTRFSVRRRAFRRCSTPRGLRRSSRRAATMADMIANSPLLRVQSAVGDFVREAAAREAASQEMVERLAPPPAPEPHSS